MTASPVDGQIVVEAGVEDYRFGAFRSSIGWGGTGSPRWSC
jgi:hypothetical protein